MSNRRMRPAKKRLVRRKTPLQGQYIHGSNAVAPDLAEMNYKWAALRLRENKATPEQPKQRKRDFFRLPRLRTVLCIFVLAVLVAAQYTAVQTMGYRVNEAQKKLAEMKAVNEQLEQEYASLSSLSRIEKIATEELGMIHPQKVVVYTPTVPKAEGSQ